MKRYSFLFFYYLLIASTILLVGSIFFVPNPYKLIQIIVLTPAVLYLWIRLTSPETALENQWALRFVIVTVALSVIGAGGYYFSAFAPKDNSNEELKLYLSDQIKDLKNQISQLEQMKTNSSANPTAISDANNTFDVLSASNSLPTPSPIPALGHIQVTGDNDLDVYAQANQSSQVLGVALHNTTYQFFDKNGSWYFVDYTNGSYGWITSANIKEVK